MSVEKAVQACYQQTTSRGFLYQLAADFPAFKGHFEKYPVLPAVCQLSFCADAASRLLAKQVEVQAVRRAKFMGPALPNTQLEVCLTQRSDGWYLAELLDYSSQKKLSQLIVQFAEKK